MFCLEVLIDGVRRFIYSLFHMGWWRFDKVRVIINIYFQGFLQWLEDRYVLISKVSLVWGIQRVVQEDYWWKEVQFCALIIEYGYIFVIQSLCMEGFVCKIFYYFEWYAESIDKLIEIARVEIGLELDMIFDNVTSFEVLGWDEIRVMTFMMASAEFFDNMFLINPARITHHLIRRGDNCRDQYW